MSKKPVMAPTPFSAEEIRSASPEGRSWTFRRIGPDGAIGYAQTTFLEVDAMEARYRTEQRNASGDPIGDATVSTSTWEGFRQDAEFPAAVTTVEAETLDTDLGRFDVRVYRVSPDAASGPTRVFYFAAALPGPPIRVTVTMGGGPETVVMDMVERN